MRVHKLREGEWIIVKNFRSAATEKEPKWRRWPELPADAMGTYVISDHGRCFVGMVIGPNTTPPGLTDGLLWYGPVPTPVKVTQSFFGQAVWRSRDA